MALLLPLATACTGLGSSPSTTQTSSPATTVSSTSIPMATTSSGPESTTTTPYTPLATDPVVRVPEGDGPFPTVVLVHGGGWVGGDTGAMEPLARFLTGEGFITVNTDYALSSRDHPGFPNALDDIACAVRYARTIPEGDGTVAVVGHSAGAHLAAVVALTGDEYGANCPYQGSGLPERLVGLAGPYDSANVGFLMVPFFGGGPDVVPEAWAAGNPQLLVEENTSLHTLLLHGDADGIAPIEFSFDFADALSAAGSDVLMEVVEDATHVMVLDPDLVGDLIATWLLR